jgi:hypothetical protein
VLRDHVVPCLPCKPALALGACCKALVEVCRTALTHLGVVHVRQLPARLAAHPNARSLVIDRLEPGIHAPSIGIGGGDLDDEEKQLYGFAALALVMRAKELRHIGVREQCAAQVVMAVLRRGGLPALDSLECGMTAGSEQPILSAMQDATRPTRARLMRSLRRLSLTEADPSVEGFQSVGLLTSLTHLTIATRRPAKARGIQGWDHLPRLLSPALDHLHIHMRACASGEGPDVVSLLLRLRAIQEASSFKLRSLHIVSEDLSQVFSESARGALAYLIAENAPSLEDCTLQITEWARFDGRLWWALAKCRRLRTLDLSHDMIPYLPPVSLPPPPDLPALWRLRVTLPDKPQAKEGLWAMMQHDIFPRLTRLELVNLKFTPPAGVSEMVTRALASIAPTLQSLRLRRLSVSEALEPQLGGVLAGFGRLSSLSLHFTSPGLALQCLSGMAARIDSVGTAMPLRVLEVDELRANDLVAFMTDPPRGLVRPTVEALSLGYDKSKKGPNALTHGRLEPLGPPSPAARVQAASAGGDDTSDDEEGGDEGGMRVSDGADDLSDDEEGGWEEGEEAQARFLEGGKARVEDLIMAWLTSPQIKGIRSVVFHNTGERGITGAFGGEVHGAESKADRVFHGMEKLHSLYLL